MCNFTCDYAKPLNHVAHIQLSKVCARAAVLLFLLCHSSLIQQGLAEDNAGMRLGPGLKCTVAASDNLVHDAFTLTTDDLGQPVVSGPGYIRTLIDSNSDGVYEKAVDWLRVEQGAQGLWREGNQLYYVADGGLWRSIDANGDYRGDGRAEKLLSLPTGGEHDAHAIRKGPDGYWYLTNGNFSTTQMRSLLNDSESPIKDPKMGLIWRISPDFKTRSVWAHGLRNTYDFDFLPNGEIVTYDSDEERELTLPAYRPTRVYVVSPGSDGGWVSTAWIDNDARLTMPLNLASLGRGSPTGVCVYQHSKLGERFRNAIMVLDWTFGRLIAVYPQASKTQKDAGFNPPGLCDWEVIMEPGGTGGFAPTDLSVAPNGDVLVVTGGRGTLGTLYRLTSVEPKPEQAAAPKESSFSLVAAETEVKDGERIAAKVDLPDANVDGPVNDANDSNTSADANDVSLAFINNSTRRCWIRIDRCTWRPSWDRIVHGRHGPRSNGYRMFQAKLLKI